jgi:hypothetical protein
MRTSHRSTQVRVSDEPQNSNFEAATALENLRAEVIEIEALARAAEVAADALPAPTTDRQRLVFGRIQALATKTSQQASASLHFANTQVTALAAQMEVRRKQRAERPRVPTGPGVAVQIGKLEHRH